MNKGRKSTQSIEIAYRNFADRLLQWTKKHSYPKLGTDKDRIFENIKALYPNTPHQKPFEHLPWFCLLILKNDVHPQDLKAVSLQVDELFHILPILPKTKKNLQSITELTQISKILDAHQKQKEESIQEHETQQQQFLNQHLADLTPKEKDSISRDTLFIYESEQGRIIIPKSKESAIYWGKGTKWKVSSTVKYANKFHSARKNGGMIMFIANTPTKDKKTNALKIEKYLSLGESPNELLNSDNNNINTDDDNLIERVVQPIERLIKKFMEDESSPLSRQEKLDLLAIDGGINSRNTTDIFTRQDIEHYFNSGVWSLSDIHPRFYTFEMYKESISREDESSIIEHIRLDHMTAQYARPLKELFMEIIKIHPVYIDYMPSNVIPITKDILEIALRSDITYADKDTLKYALQIFNRQEWTDILQDNLKQDFKRLGGIKLDKVSFTPEIELYAFKQMLKQTQGSWVQNIHHFPRLEKMNRLNTKLEDIIAFYDREIELFEQRKSRPQRTASPS